MKKIFIAVLLITLSCNTNSETESQNKVKLLKTEDISTFKLFPTQNTWTFLKLNTRNGRIWQTQFDIDGNNRFSTELNTIRLCNVEEELNGRFTLYSTKNMYNFILLDKVNGKTWQIQWSHEAENRGIIDSID